MTDETSMTKSTPWHLWVVGVVSLLWNAFGGYDFIMSATQGETYWRASGMSQAMIDYYGAMPAWMYVPWVLGVWGAVAGSILLLMRSRWAVPVFALSLLGAVMGLGYQIVAAPPLAGAEGLGGNVMPFVIIFVALALFLYARAMQRRGVLR